MRLSRILIAAAVVLGAMAIGRVVRGAEQPHPAMTSDAPPGWRLYVTLPGEEPKARGRFSDNRTSCQLDLASESYVVPTGTRLVCLRIGSDGKVRR